jgi:hypothetical protein
LQGKTNQFGRLEISGALRHKEVRVCLLGHLATYFFWRWHIDVEPFPIFKTSKDWYNTKILRANAEDPTTTLSYRAHYGAVVKAFQALGIKAKAKTHVSRGSGARMAEVAGATEAQIRRLGRWNNNTMEGCYLTALPREAMRGLAGFSPGSSSFFLSRATMQPSDILQKRVFPEVDHWLEAQETGVGCEPNIAAGEFQ